MKHQLVGVVTLALILPFYASAQSAPVIDGSAPSVTAAVPSSTVQINRTHGSGPIGRDPALNGQGINQGGTEPFSSYSPSPTISDIAPSPSVAEYNSAFEHWRRTNGIGQALRSLSGDGIVVRGNYIENLAGNPIGGEAKGFVASQWADVGADFDLHKLFGWKGAVVHLQGAWFWGRSVGRDYIGNSISFQQTWRAVPGPRLTTLDIEQNLLNDRLNLMVGRAAVNSFYATSPLNCDFMSNTSCLALYGPITAIGITAFPNSSWAGKARFAFTRHIYGQLGAFEYNNALNTEGRDGLDFGTGSATGYILPGEIGYESSFHGDRYPRRYEAGFYYNSAAAQDPFFDTKGTGAAAAHLTRVSYAGGRIGLYSVIDQTVWRIRPGTEDNLTVFGRVFYNAGNVNTIDTFVSGGFVLTGPFASRHEDTVGFLISDTHFSDREIRNLTAIRKLAGGSGNPDADEVIGEVNYGYQVVPGLKIIPNVQYVINPDPINAPKSKVNVPDAIVLGLKIDVHLGEILGSRYTKR